MKVVSIKNLAIISVKEKTYRVKILLLRLKMMLLNY